MIQTKTEDSSIAGWRTFLPVQSVEWHLAMKRRLSTDYRARMSADSWADYAGTPVTSYTHATSVLLPLSLSLWYMLVCFLLYCVLVHGQVTISFDMLLLFLVHPRIFTSCPLVDVVWPLKMIVDNVLKSAPGFIQIGSLFSGVAPCGLQGRK